MAPQPDGQCPFCKTGFSVYEPMGDDETSEIECRNCERTFQVVASIQIHYYTRCLDADHDWKHDPDVPKLDICSVCGKARLHK